VTELVTEYIEGTLGAHETALFEQHLNFCDGCDWYVDQMRTRSPRSAGSSLRRCRPTMQEALLAAFRDRERS
jgi:hypothetical protein